MPSPAASAQALPWGTPGQGSGSRSRQTPGRTRSPRPTSLGRWLTGRDSSVRRMGKRSRRRRAEGAALPELEAPTADYADAEGNVLTLRGVLTPKTRQEYAALDGGRVREDAWHRRVEFLFERLAVRWELAGLPYEGQAELLARFRAASPDERSRVREALREHVAEWFPDVAAP